MGRRAKNPFHQDEIIFRDEDHSYTEIKTGKKLTPVSTLISKYSAPFDPHGFIIRKCAAKEGISVDELRARWDKKRDDACARGSDFHSQAEEYFLTGKIPDGPDSDILTDLAEKVKFQGKVYPEILVYSTELGIAGQSDVAVYYKEDNSVAIQDFKTNAELYKKSYKKLLFPLDYLDDTKINKYALQLSTYAYLLELKGFKIRADELQIFWINPERKIQIIPIPYLKSNVQAMIDHHLNGFDFF